jgi:putative CocE/NonD family hydrolase
MRTHPEETFLHLPLREVPIARYGKLKELLEFRLSAAERPSGGNEDLERYAKLETPIFHECGWYDPVAWNQFDAFAKMRKHGGTDLARQAQFMTVGPWQHAVEHPDRLGDIWFGLTSSTSGSGTNQRQIAYFDRYLRGKDTELPPVRYFVMGVNEWRHADDWPLPGTTWQRYYLRSNGAANSSSGDGVLSTEPPADEAPDSYIYDPETPVPTLGGNYVGVLNVPGMLVGPVDQYFVERRNDVLVYTTKPFEADTEVSGPLQLHLFASTSAVDTDFTAKICHVYPDGRSYNLCEGIVRLRGRNLRSEWDEVTPGEVYALTITIGQTSLVVQKGHALRLQVSSSNFPQFDRNMNTGNPIGTDAHGVRALQTVFHDLEHASYIDLPVVPDQGTGNREQDTGEPTVGME